MVVDKTLSRPSSILVVDDDDLTLQLTKEILQTLAYRVDAVESGEAALAYLKERQADLLVLDMNLYNGIDGTETYRQALKMRPKQKAIIVSALDDDLRIREALALGAGSHVRKPVTMRMLARAVENELAK